MRIELLWGHLRRVYLKTFRRVRSTYTELDKEIITSVLGMSSILEI